MSVLLENFAYQNPILSDISNSKNGNYCHCLEVRDLQELESILEALYSEFIETYDFEDIENFFTTINIYCLDDDNENEVFALDVKKFILELS